MLWSRSSFVRELGFLDVSEVRKQNRKHVRVATRVRSHTRELLTELQSL